MKVLQIQIIPAQPGYFTIIDLDDVKKVELGEPVIGWRIETYDNEKFTGVYSVCVALTVDGDAASNCIGVQNPENTVTVFEEKTYRSLAELQAHRYPKK